MGRLVKNWGTKATRWQYDCMREIYLTPFLGMKIDHILFLLHFRFPVCFRRIGNDPFHILGRTYFLIWNQGDMQLPVTLRSVSKFGPKLFLNWKQAVERFQPFLFQDVRTVLRDLPQISSFFYS